MYTTEIRILRLKNRLALLESRPLTKDNSNVVHKIKRQLRNFGVEI